MKKSLRKASVLFSTAVMLGSQVPALVSAQEVNPEGFPIVDEPITMTMIAPGTGMSEWKDMPTLQYY